MELEKNKVWDVLASTEAVSHSMHARITGTPESENILQPYTAGYLHWTTIWMYIYIYINTREKTTNMHHSLFIQKDQLSLRVPMNTPTQLLSHVGERTINTAIILSKVPESQLHYYLHRLISLGFVLRLFMNKDCRNWMANSFHRMTQSRAWVITGSLFSFWLQRFQSCLSRGKRSDNWVLWCTAPYP